MLSVEDAYSMFVDEEEARRERWLRSRPVCSCCGEPIQDEYYWEIEEGKFCEECAERWLKGQRVLIMEGD